MMRMQLGLWQASLPTAVAFVVLGGALTACHTQIPASEPDCLPGVAPSTREQLDACLRGVRFDPAPEVSDSQPLTVIGTEGAPCPGNGKKKCRFGPLATIQPAKRAHKYSDTELREGRIIAKLSIPSSETEDYQKYGLKRGQDTFWWVQIDAAGTGGQSVFITRTKDGGIELEPPRALKRYVYSEEEKLSRSIARWLWDLDDEKTQGTCGGGTCR